MHGYFLTHRRKGRRRQAAAAAAAEDAEDGQLVPPRGRYISTNIFMETPSRRSYNSETAVLFLSTFSPLLLQ